MNIEEMKAIIDVTNNKVKADIVFKNANIIDVYLGKITKGDVAIKGKYIVGIGDYTGLTEIDASGKYLSPGLIDSHMHIESTYLAPGEAAKLLVPRGTTTIVADPHEIVNVCGNDGLEYMIEASNNTVLDIKYMIPSCVPCTPFETSGYTFRASDVERYIDHSNIVGLGEFMNYVGVNNADDEVMKKLFITQNANKIIDGHAPGLTFKQLDGYASTKIKTDHECSTVEEVEARISRGMYVAMRQGSACRDLEKLLPAITKENLRYCMLCSDDREPETIINLGHIDDCLRICVANGVDPVAAIRMATINVAECYRMDDRGSIAPGKLANIVLFDDLTNFYVEDVYIEGKKVSCNGKYLVNDIQTSIKKVSNTMHVEGFTKDKLSLKVSRNTLVAMEVVPEGVLTKKVELHVQKDKDNEYLYDKSSNVCKIAAVERHHGTGNVGVGLLRGFGIKEGAIAQTIGHDSHNIIAVGMSDEDISLAINSLIENGGGIIVIKEGKVIAELKLPIAGLMSDKSGIEVAEEFSKIHQACKSLGIYEKEPIVQLSFMSLPVIPEIKITDKGLFDVTNFTFIKQ